MDRQALIEKLKEILESPDIGYLAKEKAAQALREQALRDQSHKVRKSLQVLKKTLRFGVLL